MFLKFFSWVSRFTTRVLGTTCPGPATARVSTPCPLSTEAAFTLEITPAETLRSLELSWMGATTLDESPSLEMQSQHSADTCNQHDAGAEAEYLDLTTIQDDLLDNHGDDLMADTAGSLLEQLSADLIKKESECEHLRQVIKQLVFSRAKLSKTSVEIQERYAQLQAEFFKACKVAQLARSVSSEHMQRNTKLQKQVNEFGDRAHRAERQAAEVRKRNLDLIAENQQMKQRLAALEKQQQQNWDAGSCHSTFLRGFPLPRSQTLI